VVLAQAAQLCQCSHLCATFTRLQHVHSFILCIFIPWQRHKSCKDFNSLQWNFCNQALYLLSSTMSYPSYTQPTKLCVRWARVQPWPYHEPSRHAVEQNWTPSYPINAPQGPHRVYYGPSWLDMVNNRPSAKADLLIYNNSFATLSGQCTSVAIIISNKVDFNSYAYMEGFCKSSHMCVYITLTPQIKGKCQCI